MSHYQWDTTFTELYHRCVESYRNGDHNFDGYYSEDDHAFLKSIGYKPREFFDFIEDYVEYGEPSPTTAVMIANQRRSYLQYEMHGRLSSKTLLPDDLPPRDAEMGGIAWLPRIIAKARAKLRGELDPDIMYCCGGDRGFLRSHDIFPADFLRAVWCAGNDDSNILGFVRRNASG